MTSPRTGAQAVTAADAAGVITTAAQYRAVQDAAISPLLKRVRQLFHLYGVPITPEQRTEMSMQLWRVTRQARARNYAATLRYLSGKGIRDGIPDLAGFPVQALETGLQDLETMTVNGEPVTEANRHQPHVVETGRKAAEGKVYLAAQAPAREVVKEVADSREGVGWARVLTGPTSCSFCAMLASRGPVYSSRESALGRGGNPLNLYHTAHLNKTGKLVGGNCDCIAELVVGPHWEGADAHAGLEDLWTKTTKGLPGKKALNAFRRTWYQKVKNGETQQFLAASIQPPGGASTPGG